MKTGPQIELNERHYKTLHRIFDYMNAACLSIIEVDVLTENDLEVPSTALMQEHLFTAVGLGLDNQMPETIRLILAYLDRNRLVIVDTDPLYDAGIFVPYVQWDRRHLYAAVGIDPAALAFEQDQLADSLREA